MKALFLPVLMLAGSVTIQSAYATQSHDVATRDIQFAFGVGQNPMTGFADLSADLYKVSVVNGQTQLTALELSGDEHIVFTVGPTTLVYDNDPNQQQSNFLPYLAGATYAATITRANGETYTSRAVMPQPVAFSVPVEGAGFGLSDAIDVKWNAVASDLAMNGLATNCKREIDNIPGGDVSAHFDPGFFSNCGQSPVENAYLRLDFSFGTPFVGAQGSLSANGFAYVDFHVGAGASETSMPALLPRGVRAAALRVLERGSRSFVLRLQ